MKTCAKKKEKKSVALFSTADRSSTRTAEMRKTRKRCIHVKKHVKKINRFYSIYLHFECSRIATSKLVWITLIIIWLVMSVLITQRAIVSGNKQDAAIYSTRSPGIFNVQPIYKILVCYYTPQLYRIFFAILNIWVFEREKN